MILRMKIDTLLNLKIKGKNDCWNLEKKITKFTSKSKSNNPFSSKWPKNPIVLFATTYYRMTLISIVTHVKQYHKEYMVHFIMEAVICSLRMRFSRKYFHLLCIVDLNPMAYIVIKFEDGFCGFSLYEPRRLSFQIEVDRRVYKVVNKTKTIIKRIRSGSQKTIRFSSRQA